VTADRAPTVVFTVAGHTPEQVDQHLASRRIAVWHGDNYACELVDALGLRASGGVVRAGVVRYTTADDVAALLAAVAELSLR
jgi:selenocysteine lyase/cysteine desulfurase